MSKITPDRAPPSWLDAIERSEAELAAGKLLDFEEVMREFDAADAGVEHANNARTNRTPRQAAGQ